MKRKQILATFAWLAAIMMTATFTSCANDDNPAGGRPIDGGDGTLVTNDEELRSAIADGATILLANDIQLNNSTLSIPEGATVTVNLGGFTLDRGLTKREWNTGGQVITVRSGATLNLSNGTLKGGWGGDSGGINNEGGTANLTDVNITGCTGDDKGGGICNRSGSTLTMKGGSITGNISNDHTTPEGGGGIFNAEGATATLTGVTIAGNEAKVKGGGGICNYGTMTIDGCTIQKNIARMNGGGIWNGKEATLSIKGGSISGNTAGDQGGGIYTHSSFSMQGAVIITGNKKESGVNNNVYLTPDAVITVTGALTGSSIGMTMENATGTFTSGYSAENSGTDPATVFKADLPEVQAISLDDNSEAQVGSSLPEGTIYYIERSWDPVNNCLTSTVRTWEEGEYTLLKSSDDEMTLTGLNYVVKGNVSISARVYLKPQQYGMTNIVLCDGAKLTMEDGAILFHEDTDYPALNFYGQQFDSGKLDMSDSDVRAPRIGNRYDTHGGIAIYGGTYDLRGGGNSPAIGAYSSHDIYGETPDFNAKAGSITIYGGNIKAKGGRLAAAIGTGRNNTSYDVITIYGGNITATGGDGDVSSGGGAAIGGGLWIQDGTVNIYGGNIIAQGSEESAGIGCGEGDDMLYEENNGAGTINIYGGNVTARGGTHAAGIGTGDGCSGKCDINISGGHVIAYGGTDAAGIGGGEGGPGGNITISGGFVEAYGNDYGAGIGGGQDGEGGNIKLLGGTIIAKAGRDETGSRAVGPGSGSDDYGSLAVGDLLMVSSERLAVADERVPMCWYRTQARIEPCTHPGYAADTCPYHKH